MTECERLIELMRRAFMVVNGNHRKPILGQVADYLLSNGVIVPPSKVGDTVWVAVSCFSNNLLELGIAYIGIYTNYIWFHCYGGYSFDTNAIGKTVFLTREEAEAALAERSKG